MKHIFWEFFLPLHQTELLRPAANHRALPVVLHLWVNWSASAGYRGNYNLAMTCVWFYCLTLWHTWWDIGDLKLKAHSGNLSVFPLGALLLTKQSLAEMNQDHHREEKKLCLFLSSSQSAFFVEIQIQCIQRRRVCSRSLHPLPYGWLKKLQSEKNNFTILLSRYFFTDLPVFKLRIVLMLNRIRNWMKNTIM